jgi:hypothetical protein
MESFWSSMQIELLDRQTWNTRVELANAIFEYIEIWHNRARRHSSIGHLTPIDFELQSETHAIPARTTHLIRQPNPGQVRDINQAWPVPSTGLDPMSALSAQECIAPKVKTNRY